jgi:hypothetical protein
MSSLAPISMGEIAEQCRRRARLPTTENMTAVVLLLAGKALDDAEARTVRLAATNERLEAKRA